MTGFSRGFRKRPGPSRSEQESESQRFADRPWATPRTPSPTVTPETPAPDARRSTEHPPTGQPVQRRFTIEPAPAVTPVARVSQPVISRPVVQAKVGIGFELRDLPVDDDAPILDVTVAATRPPIDSNTKTAVLKRQGLNKLPAGNAFRHIIAYDDLVVRLENGLKGKTSDEAREWLRRSAPQGSIYQVSGQLSNRVSNQVNTNRRMVEDGALLWLKKWQNHPANLFVGSASENSSHGSNYDDPTQADGGSHQQAFASGRLDQVFEESEQSNLNLRQTGLWFGPLAATAFQGKAQTEGAQYQAIDAENAILQWLYKSGSQQLALQIHGAQAQVRQSDAWQGLVETIVARTTGKVHNLEDMAARYWRSFERGIVQALPQQVTSPPVSLNNVVNLKRDPEARPVQLRREAPPAASSMDRPRAARGPDVRIGLRSGASRSGPPLIIQAKEGVDVSYELRSQPIHSTSPITSVTVSGARPAIRAATKTTVLNRYSVQQQADFVSSGTTLKKGWVWRHIIPYATLATRLEAALEGKTIQEANQWLTDNRPLGAPAEGQINGALSPRLQLEARALSWIDGWQNNPANLFIGSSAENSSLKDDYDDPQTADKNAYAGQHLDQNRQGAAFTYSTPNLTTPASDFNKAPYFFFGVGALKDLEQQTTADNKPSLDSSQIENLMFELLQKTPGEDAQTTVAIWNKEQDGHLKLRAAPGWQSIIRLYAQWSKGRPKPDQQTIETLWTAWWPRFSLSIRQQMEKKQIGVSTGLIPLGGRKESLSVDFKARIKEQREKIEKEKEERRNRSSGGILKKQPSEKEKQLLKIAQNAVANQKDSSGGSNSNQTL